LIFLTGATGFIGRQLVERLCAVGRPVRCLALPDDPLAPQLPAAAEIVRGDVTELAGLLPHGAGVDTLVHAAAAQLPNRPERVLRVNQQGTANLIECARAWGARRFVYLSAVSATYEVKNVYGRSKVHAETLVRESGLDHTILRLTMVFGPGGGHHFRTFATLAERVPLVYPVVGAGRAKLQPVWLDDVVEAILRSLERPVAIGQTYNVSGGSVLTLNQLIDAVLAAGCRRRLKLHVPTALCMLVARALSPVLGGTPLSPDALLGVDQDATLDNTALRRDLAIEPLTFEEGLRRLFGPTPEAFAGASASPPPPR